MSRWQDLWRRWSHYERLWKDDTRHVILNSLLTLGETHGKTDLAVYRKRKALPQPTVAEIDELLFLGSQCRELARANHPLEDVYAAACYMKSMRWEYMDRHYAFRGQRCDNWPLVPSIQRQLPEEDEALANRILESRLRTLAVFSEALCQMLGEDKIDELGRIAIAQHYGIPSPLCDLTWSPWVALYFASAGGTPDDYGLVQCFSMSELGQIMGHEGSKFGAVRVVEVDFVPRIVAQQGLFIELPRQELVRQMVPWSLTFAQREGVVFEDADRGVSEALLFPSDASDRFAPFARPSLSRYPKVSRQRPVTAAEYLDEARAWYPQWFERGGSAVDRRANELCDFHCRLQSITGLRPSERSFSRLHGALSRLFLSHQEGRLCDMEDLVGCYVSQAHGESAVAIRELWRSMSGDHSRASD